MGADLFIGSLQEEQRRQWEPEFEKAARLRDSLKKGSSERQQAQARVEECFEKMREKGYFRDPYNDWDLLWKFRLSWWEDVIPMLDEEERLSVERVEHLLALLHERENVFDLKLAQLPADEQTYFRQ